MKKIKNFFSRRRSSRLGAAPPDLSPAVPSTPTLKDEAGRSTRITQLSKFEQLPFDVHHHVLLAVDTIEDLGALVRAIPVYHEQYLRRRDFWLWRCLWQETGPALVDAFTAHLCGSRKFQQNRNLQQTRDFLAVYYSRRSTEMVFTPSSAEDIIQMATFHSSAVRPLLRRYVSWTRSNLDALSTTPEILSRVERRRILRGFYRFEICCQFFGWSPFQQNNFGTADLRQFLSVFELWESEEILCINAFSSWRVGCALDTVRWDLHPDNPRWDEKRTDPYTPTNSFHIGFYEEEYRNGIVSLGLSLLHTIFNIRDLNELLQPMSDNMVTIYQGWMTDAAYIDEMERQCQDYFSERDRAQNRRDEMPFTGDGESSPPLAWVAIWKGTYANLYGFQAIFESMRSWGYVMWDGRRLEESGAKAALEQQWKEANTSPSNGEILDPRDPLGGLGYPM